jgi:hypothetical protein
MRRLRNAWSLALILPLAVIASAPAPTNFSGVWEFNPARSKNVGMMSSLRLTSTIKQTDNLLIISEASAFNGQEQKREVRYDLTGKAVSNERPMSGPNETVSRWAGDKLVTTWTGESAIAGAKVVRTETMSLSADGKTLTVETVRGSNPPLVMVYDRK